MSAPPAHTKYSIEARTHGRFLVRRPQSPPPWPLLVGFHGYAETAEDQLNALSTIPGTDAWLIVAVQALHPFYTRSQRIVASWMTSADRELAIADNVDYVGRVLNQVRSTHQTRSPLVFAGFSQGGAMAYRAAAAYLPDAVIVLAADVPPDVVATAGAALPAVLIGRGSSDDWYTEQKERADIEALARIGVRPEVCLFDGGHEWTDTFRDAAGRLLRRLQ